MTIREAYQAAGILRDSAIFEDNRFEQPEVRRPDGRRPEVRRPDGSPNR